MSLKEKRAGNVISEQKTILCEFVKKHPQMASGKFNKDFTFKDSQQLWENLSAIVNAVPGGGLKTWKQWRKVWQDLRSKSKAKKSRINKHQTKTGGGQQCVEVLNENDIEILDLINPIAIEGLNVPESCIDMGVQKNEIMEISEETSTDENKIFRNTEVDEQIEKGKDIQSDQDKIETPSLKKKSKITRLEKVLSATDHFSKFTKKKIEIKENYYKKKLALLERKVEAKEKKNMLLERDIEVKENFVNLLNSIFHNSS